MVEDKHLNVPVGVIDVQAKSSALEQRRGNDLVSRRSKVIGTVYLLLDHSASMADGNKLRQVKRGALRFFGEAWLRDYAVGAIAFSYRAVCLSGASRNFYRFQKSLVGLEPHGRTAMASAIRLGVRRLRWRRGKRALILITDGQPNSREATLRAAQVARAAGIELIAVGTDGADEAFLASLTPKPELAAWVEVDALEGKIADAAQALPEG